MISIDHFKELEIKIGTIKEASVMEGADKLLVLKIDFGEEELRQIVSGIRARFETTEELIGMQVAFATNLEPREIRGHMSQGMILACGTDDAFALLVPHAPVNSGSKVR